MSEYNANQLSVNEDLISREQAIEKAKAYKIFAPTDGVEKTLNAVIEAIAHSIAEHPAADVSGCRYWDSESRFCSLGRPAADVAEVQPERLTDDDFETIRIHLSAYKERLCNQHSWKEAAEYQRIIDRFMAFASAQPEPLPSAERRGRWENIYSDNYKCSVCGAWYRSDEPIDFVYCPNCGARMDSNAIQHTGCVENALDALSEVKRNEN